MESRVLQITKQDESYISTICSWYYHWWGKEEGFTLEKMRVYVTNSMCQDRIPQTHIILKGQEIIGVYQFSITDLDVRPDIYPWLINVYIDQPYRRQGYFKLLMDSVRENCKKLGIQQIFLYTTHHGLYEKFGWEFIEEFNTFIKGKEIQRLYSWNF